MEVTPDSSTTDHSQDVADGVTIPSRRLFERKVTKLRHFNKEIPQFTQHRFHDLHELFERPLCEFLTKANIKCNAISVKLTVLGESETTAKPWIMILCDKAASKKIRQFFNQPQIKAEYHPPKPDSFLPSFKVLVCDRAPRPMAGTEVYGDCDEKATMCGRIIRIGDVHQSRFATLGGVMKIVKPPGITMLYGMTAGHILSQQPLGNSSFDQVGSCDGEGEEEYEEDEGFYSGEEEFELDDSTEGDEDVQGFATTGDRTQPVAQDTQLGNLLPKIGCIYTASIEETGTEHNLDWALIDFDEPADCRANRLVILGSEEGGASTRPLKENGNLPEDGSSRSVLVLSGTGGIKKGILSTSLSFLMMRPAKAFTKTYTLIMPHGLVLNAGDCGSWVVDPSTCDVYGHIVASDGMGDTYVVPLNATIRDMEKKLRAAVSLPTEDDIHAWLAQQAKAAAKQTKIPARSEEDTFSTDHQKLAGSSLSQVSTFPAPSTIDISTPIVDYCGRCSAKFEGTSRDVGSNLRHHLQACQRLSKAASQFEISKSQDAVDTSDEWSNWTQSTVDTSDEWSNWTQDAVKYSRDVQMTSTKNTFAPQETNLEFLSPRSMSSSIKEKSTSGSQLIVRYTKMSASNTRDNRKAEFASSEMLAATISSIEYLKMHLIRPPRGRPRMSLVPFSSLPSELSLSAFQEPICVTFLVQKFPGQFEILPFLDAGNVLGTAKDSVHALALAFFGKAHRQSKIIQQGADCYAKALRKLAYDLNDQNAMWSPSVLLSVLILARYESIESIRSEGWIKHAGGAERLLELRGPRSYQSLEERHIFEAARLLIVMNAIENCKRTFLDREEWLTLPWAQDLDQKSAMNLLIDIFCIIPDLLEDFKSLHLNTSSVWDLITPRSLSIALTIEQSSKMAKLRRRTQECYINLQKWKEEWERVYPSVVQPVNISYFPPSDLKFPIEIFEHAIAFPNFLRANEFQLYNTMVFFLSNLMLSIPSLSWDDRITSPSVSDLLGQRWDAATDICRAVPYKLMFEKHGRGGAYILSFPLLTCLRLFGANSPEGKWIKRVLRVIEGERE